MYVRQKVFDCQKMPADIKKFVFDHYEDMSNDCYAEREVLASEYYDEDDEGHEVLITCEDHTILDAWLLENGANVGEYVIIKRWR